MVPSRVAAHMDGGSAYLDATRRHVPALDGLRCLAVLFVFGVHGQWKYATGGSVGVDIFFVLSGFLITQMLSREYLARGTIDVVEFYSNRFVRLFPALLLMCLGYLIYCGRHGWWKLAFDNIIPSLTYISNYTRSQFQHPGALGHQWSLAVEEQFYILWPSVLIVLKLRGVSDRSVTRLLGVAIAAVFFWRMWLFADHANTTRIYDGIDCHSDGLMIGCMLGLARRSTFAWVASLWKFGLAGLVIWVMFGSWNSPLLYYGGFLVVALCAATLVASAATYTDGPYFRALACGPIRWLGRISYGMYLWHFPLLGMVLMRIPMPVQTGMLLAGTASVVIASASYVLVERPLMTARRTLPRWGKRLLACAGPVLLSMGIGYRIGLGLGYFL